MSGDEACERFVRANTAAIGYLELAIAQQQAGADCEAMRLAAIRELERVANDDVLIDAMYDADMREERYGY